MRKKPIKAWAIVGESKNILYCRTDDEETSFPYAIFDTKTEAEKAIGQLVIEKRVVPCEIIIK